MAAETHRRTRETTVNVTVGGVDSFKDDFHARPIRPTGLSITYTQYPDAERPYNVRVSVSGPQIKNDGTDGQTDAEHFADSDRRRWPTWIKNTVSRYQPEAF
jgi:hypothetical protein